MCAPRDTHWHLARAPEMLRIVAVYTHLDEVALRVLWSMYRDDQELIRAEGIAAGSINTTYRLETEAGTFYLRINEAKTSDEVYYERDLLDVLRRSQLSGVITPRIMRTRVGGSFFLVERRAGRPIWAALFPALDGRELSPAEVRGEHTEQVGAFLGRAHLSLRAHHGRRANPFGISTVSRWLDDLERAEALAPAVREAVSVLRRTHGRVVARRRLLPRGVVHGDLFVDNTKWDGNRLWAVFDWEMAGRDHLTLDLAIGLLAWCWRRDAALPNRGVFEPELCQAMVRGYQAVRPLSSTEKRGLHTEALLAAVRFTTSRIRDFEVPRAGHSAAQRTYLDYRDFLGRLQELDALGDHGFRRLVGLEGAGGSRASR